MPVYDVVVCGAGLSGATAARVLTDRGKRVLVLERRSHVAGNCHDWRSQGTYVHTYGPHIFHSKSTEVVDFLSRFTAWDTSTHSVMAEVEYDDVVQDVPFPYCKQVYKKLEQYGRPFTEAQVIDLFFRGYSRKMWGVEYEDLPESVKGRVPKDTGDEPVYFPDQFVGSPRYGYTWMVEQMLAGIEVVLDADPDEWRRFTVPVLYGGRIDHLVGKSLPHRTLDIAHSTMGNVHHRSAVINFCHERVPYTRSCRYSMLTGGSSDITSLETPRAALHGEQWPYYPVQTPENVDAYAECRVEAKRIHPNLVPLGRLARYQYLDMWQAVAAATIIAEKI